MTKILVANRGEIAVRVLRACREMGLASVAVYSDADQDALHTRYADEAVHIGPTPAAQSYLSIPAVLEAARKSGATAIHPGYGFLSENNVFAQAVEDAGLTFIGPRPETIALTGDKLAARRVAQEVGIPVPQGTELPINEIITADFSDQVNFPVLIKATAGGGGRGIRLANSPAELEMMIEAARKEARAAFGDDTVYLEQLVQRARHIEVQVLGDGHGEIVILGERECSIQRRRQKLIEEAPAPGLSTSLRHQIYDSALALAAALKYRSLGTIEFLVDDKGKFFFIEVNPRIQVEHPITEMVTRIDLVRSQLQLAEDPSLRYIREHISMDGAAIEARVLAEDPSQGFLPATGEITYLKEPGGPGVRMDSALYLGMPVTSDYDSLMSKVIVWGEDRPAAIRRLQRALLEYQIGGVPTTLEFLTQIIESEPFEVGRADTTYLDTFKPAPLEGTENLERDVALAAALLAYENTTQNSTATDGTSQNQNNWRTAAWREQMRGGFQDWEQL